MSSIECDFSCLSKLSADSSIDTLPYLLSNEVHRERSKISLYDVPRIENGVHIGFSCWENLDIAAARRSFGAIICDISQSAHHAMRTTAKVLSVAADRFDFVEKFQKLEIKLREDTDIASELKRQESWLVSDESFQFVQDLFKNDRVALLQLDIRDRMRFQAIQKWLTKRNLCCDTLYLSNILDWIHENGTDRDMTRVRFALSQVIRDETAVIIASAHFNESAGLPQRVLRNQSPFDPKTALFSNNSSDNQSSTR